MECEKARENIINYFYDELDSNDLTSLEDHLAVCNSCSEYKQEIQSIVECLDQQKEVRSDIDLMALHNSIEKKRSFSNLRLPVWATAFLILFVIALSSLALSKAEFQWANNTLTIRFGGAYIEEKAEPVEQAKIQAQIDDLKKKNDRILTEQKKEQLRFQIGLAKNMDEYQRSLIKLLNDYESNRDVQIAKLIQQIQLRNYQSLMAMRNDFDVFASRTENEFKRSYVTMATMAELLSYQPK